ncbi:hypothetical protein D3C93_02885 [Listeria monocytogenes]|nr:hypothetical protein [Listeria monocytogenes]
MSVKACYIEVKSAKNEDGYATIATTWVGKDMPVKPLTSKKTGVMWSHECVFGVIGSKIGDFIPVHSVNSSLQEGVFTQRDIATQLIATFSGLKMTEIEWRENPLADTSNDGKTRAKWLPEKEYDIVHLFSDVYIDVCQPDAITSDFFTVIEEQDGYERNWFMCTEQAKKILKKMNFENIRVGGNKILG